MNTYYRYFDNEVRLSTWDGKEWQDIAIETPEEWKSRPHKDRSVKYLIASDDSENPEWSRVDFLAFLGHINRAKIEVTHGQV